MIEFEVPGPAVAKARPRIVTLTSKSGRAFSHSYTPKKTANYENWVKLCFQEAKPDGFEPYTGPVELHIRVYEAIPASFSKKRRIQAVTGEIFPTKKPDIDNYLKNYMDALRGLAFLDDKQAVYASVSKKYAAVPTAFVKIDAICRG
jgi:Holliday junction resolvase RusA-like endonuclease